MPHPIATIAARTARCGRLLWLAIAAAAVLTAAPAQAEWKGELSSTILNRLPARPAFDVVIYDDTDANLAFRDAFLNALSRSGYQISDTAPYVFSFATSIAWKEKRAREVQSERIRKYPVERGETTIPLGKETDADTRQETRMFGDRRTTAPLIAPHIGNDQRDRLDISVTLRDRDTSKVMWVADLALPILEYNRDRIVRAIIPAIIGSIGRNADHEPFEIK